MTGFYVGHGRHWNFYLQSGKSQEDLLNIFNGMVRDQNSKVIFDKDGTKLLYLASGDLGVGVLLCNSKIYSAFPSNLNGHTWSVEVNDKNKWHNNIEGQYIGSCHGAAISWFDTNFLQSEVLLNTKKTVQNLTINALAYQITPTVFKDAQQENLMGGMKAFMPLHNEGASGDEIQFMSQIEQVRYTDFFGVPLEVYTVTLALPDDFPMRIDVYTALMAREKPFQVGDRVTGICWLFGQLAN